MNCAQCEQPRLKGLHTCETARTSRFKPGQLVRMAAGLNKTALQQVLDIFREDHRPNADYCKLHLEDLHPCRPEPEVFDPNANRYMVTLEIDDPEVGWDEENIVFHYGPQLLAMGVDHVRVITLNEGTSTDWKQQKKAG